MSGYGGGGYGGGRGGGSNGYDYGRDSYKSNNYSSGYSNGYDNLRSRYCGEVWRNQLLREVMRQLLKVERDSSSLLKIALSFSERSFLA
jgi:hypothetical protein